MLYATTEQFDPQHPDENRLPWDYFGKELWEMTKG
jgi:dTDP-4-dehydrorhamnose 3,5-epimerase